MNAYGPAECSDDVAFHAVRALADADCVVMPIGRPTANNQLYIVDAALRPVPIGAVGEIGVAGVGVGRGYVGDADRTKAVFVDNPFAPGTRFYLTGDLGRWREDGVIEFLGRRDQQVKVRGHRIELGEIESRLERHPAVEVAAVVAVPDGRGDTRLVGYWQASGGAAATAAELAEHLGRELPGYMVPSVLVEVAALPLSANGKVDRKALAARAVDEGAGGERAYAAPRTASEAAIAGIWSEVLGVEQVSVDEPFFALGGHSLLATQVMSRVRTRLGVELPLRALFEHPTVAALARAVDAASASSGGLPPIVRRARRERLPLSFAQQRLWFLEQMSGPSGLYVIPFALRLRGALDVEALHRSFEQLIERHAVLRTAIVNDRGEPWQEIRSAASCARFELPVIETADVRAELDAVRAAPFDLARPPLVRARLLRIAPDEHVLAIAIHHLAVDGWSIALLVEDLVAAYRGDALPPGDELQYADYAAWQRAHVPGALWNAQLAYWRAQLGDAPPLLRLPSAREPARAGDRGGARVRRTIPRDVLAALQQRSEQQGATLFMLLHAALCVVLHQQTGRGDLVVGADVANRNRTETERIVGFFVNQLALRTRVRGDQRFADVLAECQRVALAAYEHQDLPFDALVAELLAHRDGGHAPLFQIKLVLQNMPAAQLALPGLAIDELPVEPREVELDLLINAVATDDGLLVAYDHRTAIYSTADVEALADLLEIALGEIARAPALSVAELGAALARRQAAAAERAIELAHTERDRERAALTTARRRTVERP